MNELPKIRLDWVPEAYRVEDDKPTYNSASPRKTLLKPFERKAKGVKR